MDFNLQCTNLAKTLRLYCNLPGKEKVLMINLSAIMDGWIREKENVVWFTLK